MNETMPRTPFSTPLSGSARETELRLRAIFSGPKKRPPALFLAAMFAVCLFCGNLVSCQVAEAEAPEGSTSVAPDSSASVAVDDLPAAPGEREWLTAELDIELLQNNEHLLDDIYDALTDKEAELLENLPAGELPREAVDVFHATWLDYWRCTLLPAAYDREADVTVYYVVNPDSMPDVEPLVSPQLWGDLELRGIVLRHGGRTAYFPLCWEGNAHQGSSPRLLVDDLDKDGQPEAAVVLCLGWGTGCYEEDLYIFDLDTMTYTTPDYSEIPLEITYDPEKTRARMVSGDREWPVRLDDLGLPFEGEVEVGNIVEFRVEDGQMLCHLEPDFTCSTTGYVAFAEFPVIYENGTYKLGPAVHMGDIL